MTLSIHAVSPVRPASSNGSLMFSIAVSVGIKLNDWKTKPRRSRRRMVRCLSSSSLRSASPMNAEPEVNESRPAMQCSSVDFPDPDGPMMAVNRDASNATETPSSARTSVWSLP